YAPLALSLLAALSLVACGGDSATSAQDEQAAPAGAPASETAPAPATTAQGGIQPDPGGSVASPPEEDLGAPVDELMARAQAVFKPVPYRAPDPENNPVTDRSEERRVGKECSHRWAA